MSVKIESIEKMSGGVVSFLTLIDNTKKISFSFGLPKARLIIENYEEIRQFVQEYEGGTK
jgi:hypothetical protein